MANPFVAEIRIFPFNFAPLGWAFCDGQILPLAQNTALFSLLGTTYGGDGRSNFALPNLQGSAPMHPNDTGAAGLSVSALGEQGGTPTVTLLQSEMPSHSHTQQAFVGRGTNVAAPSSAEAFADSQGNSVYDNRTNPGTTALAATTILPAGSGQPHNNMMPSLTLNFCIALQGVYPPRS